MPERNDYMISSNDCIVLLTEIKQELGIDTGKYIKKVLTSGTPDIETLKFINDNRQMDLTAFYEKLRKSYNHKKSQLYIKLVKGPDSNNINEVLNTLNSYALQVTLFSRDVKDKQIFFRFTRLQEVYQCLYYYTKTYDLTNCINLLNIIRADLKTLETTYRKQENS